MKEKVGGLEAKCDQYYSYITELWEMIQSVKILQGPRRDTWEVFSTSCQARYLTVSQTLPHSVCGFQLGPHTSSLSGSSVTMFTGFPASLVTMLCLLSFKQPVL